MTIRYNNPFNIRTQNQTGSSYRKFINFALPAVGTCINAPIACKYNIKGKRPLCFSARPITNYKFQKVTAQAQNRYDKENNTGKGYKSNCIYKQYANLFLSLEKDKDKFMSFLEDHLCKEMKNAFKNYNKLNNKIFDESNSIYNEYTPQNIWNMLELHYTGTINNSNDFLKNVSIDYKIKEEGFFVNYIINQIEAKINSRNKNKDIYFRIHYSGDFYCKEYFMKWIKITDYFMQNNNIHFMAYTKEIENIEKWLNDEKRNIQGLINEINIKLVFSEMKNFYDGMNTKESAIQCFNRIGIDKNNKQYMMRYIVDNKIKINKNNCNLKCGDSCMRCYDKNFKGTVYAPVI